MHIHFPLSTSNSNMRATFFLPLILSISFAAIIHQTSGNPFPTWPTTSNNTKAVPSNETIYKVSKQLCWGCFGESIQFLFAHNLVRAAKLEFPLMWDFQLENYARWWAGIRKSDCKVQHSFPEGDFKLGENIYWGSGTSWTPMDAVRAWADEEKYYDYASNTCQSGEICGHYTQLVWKSTRRVGCARVVCEDGDVFMTCNYDPVGNYIGERPY